MQSLSICNHREFILPNKINNSIKTSGFLASVLAELEVVGCAPESVTVGKYNKCMSYRLEPNVPA